MPKLVGDISFLAVLRNGEKHLVGILEDPEELDGHPYVLGSRGHQITWTGTGKYFFAPKSPHANDIIEVPELNFKREV